MSASNAHDGARGRGGHRRVSLPGADELFRSTGDELLSDPIELRITPPEDLAAHGPGLSVVEHGTSSAGSRARRSSSGRQRHDEKITVYVSADELLELERARLTLRADHGVAVDRGRIVREALASVLADLESRGDASTLVRRLRQR
jgi:hypothetical protein